MLRALASILPSLAGQDGGETARGPGPERYWLHHAIRTLLERLAQRQPVLLVLDDVHWADAASIEVITHLVRRFRGPLLTAVAYRSRPPRAPPPGDVWISPR